MEDYMKKTISTVLILIIFLLIPNNIRAAEFEDYIDVKIGDFKSSDKLSLSSQIGFKIYEKDKKSIEIFSLDETEILVEVHNNTINILDSNEQLLYSFIGNGSMLIGSYNSYDSIIKVDQDRYRDFITLIANDNNTAAIINHIHIENYLYGVLPREIQASSSMEALKAQAVVARSYTVLNSNKHIAQGYNLCNTTHCQVYGGYEWEHPATNEAVDQTFGAYVAYDGKVVDTPYHSNSGGVTESSKNVWGGSLPYLESVQDQFSLNAPYSSWDFKLSKLEVESKLIANGIDVGKLEDIILHELYPSGRVKSLKIVGNKGERILQGTELRRVLGEDVLRSTSFTVEKDGDEGDTKVYAINESVRYATEIDLNRAYILSGNNKTTTSRNTVTRAISKDRTSSLDNTYVSDTSMFIFKGKGFGHGVGMSQYGAMEMARLGYNYEDIIKHYYKGVEVLKIGK